MSKRDWLSIASMVWFGLIVLIAPCLGSDTDRIKCQFSDFRAFG